MYTLKRKLSSIWDDTWTFRYGDLVIFNKEGLLKIQDLDRRELMKGIVFTIEEPEFEDNDWREAYRVEISDKYSKNPDKLKKILGKYHFITANVENLELWKGNKIEFIPPLKYMMTEHDIMRKVNLEICVEYNNNNPPTYYKPIFKDSILVVLGKYGGLTVFPIYETLAFRRIHRDPDTGDYWFECDGPESKSAGSLFDEMSIISATLEFLKKNSQWIVENGEITDFTLPWKLEKLIFTPSDDQA